MLEPEARVSTYIPHRLDEGYGIHADALRTLAGDGAGLVVSVDCGITASEPARAARELGIDLVITDHHNPPASLGDLPDAFGVVHPRRPDSAYPFGELCGAGVAYKLAWRLATLHAGSDRAPPESRGLLIELLGLAALGTIADVVPLVDENRAIARFGLARLKHSPFVGVRALVEASGLAGESIAAEDVGFKLGPRLNAAGRMGHARETLELLISEDRARCDELAAMLTRQNDERRALERRLTEQALELAEAAGMTAERSRAVVLRAEGWHAGVLGIVCSRLVDRLGRPVILCNEEDGACQGSGRSIEGFNLHAALEACAEHLTGFGGHDMAAGVRVESARFDAFAEAFTAVANEHLTPDDLVRPARYDAVSTPAELTPERVRLLERLAPFGAGNPPVRIRMDRVILDEAPAAFGRDGAHAGFYARSAEGGRPIRFVGWNWAAELRRLGAQMNRGSAIDVIAEPRVSVWNGRSRVEPTLVDLRPTRA